MPVSRDQFVSVYRSFLEHLPEIDERNNLFDRSWIKSDGENRVSWIPYKLILQEAAIQLPNTINQIQIYAIKLQTWKQILNEFSDDDERIEYTFEFVVPLFLAGISLPYALKQRFIFATTLLCHHASLARLGRKRVDDLPDDREIGVKTMDKFGVEWKEFQQLKSAIEKLFSERHQNSTEHFRNKFQHRLPTRSTIGYTSVVSRKDEPGGMSWLVGQRPPIDLEPVSDELKNEFALAITVYEAFKALVAEQLAETS